MPLYIPNLITASRLLTLPFIILTQQQNKPILALFFLFFAISTDFLDGYFARKFDCHTKFGEVFDPAIDKIFVVTMVFFLYQGCWLNKAITMLILMRYLVQIISFPLVKLAKITFYIRPNFLAKFSSALVYFIVFYSMLVSCQLFEVSEFVGGIFNIIIMLSMCCELLMMMIYPMQFWLILTCQKKGFD